MVSVKLLMKEDPRVAHEEIHDALGISSGSVNRILHDHLSIPKHCTCWVPHIFVSLRSSREVWMNVLTEEPASHIGTHVIGEEM